VSAAGHAGRVDELGAEPRLADEHGWPVQGEDEHPDDYNARMEDAMFGPQDADLDAD
jgi:hypothetical protein